MLQAVLLFIVLSAEAASIDKDITSSSRHCSSQSGSIDGKIVVEEDGGELLDFTTLTWQVALGSTLCYR